MYRMNQFLDERGDLSMKNGLTASPTTFSSKNGDSQAKNSVIVPKKFSQNTDSGLAAGK